jgi:hypothetical protein
VQIITIKVGQLKRKAVYLDELPRSSEDIKQLVAILAGSDERSRELLIDVAPGSVPDQIGAVHALYVPFGLLPDGGIFEIDDWVMYVLDKKMPDGMGAVLTCTSLAQCIDIETRQKMRLAVISPVDRKKSKAARVYNFKISEESDLQEEIAPPLAIMSRR